MFVLILCTHNLQVRNADIEALVHIGVPHDPNIGDKEGSQVTLRDRNAFLKRWHSLNCPSNYSKSLLLSFDIKMIYLYIQLLVKYLSKIKTHFSREFMDTFQVLPDHWINSRLHLFYHRLALGVKVLAVCSE